MPMPREYTIILNDLVEDNVLKASDVLSNVLNWLSEDDVYAFCQEEYSELVNNVYRLKYDVHEDEN
jgi:hypothetical protein